MHDLRFILFGGEEQGLFGSMHYVAGLSAAERSRISAAVNMDMIGSLNGPSPSVLLEGATVSQPVIDGLAEAAATYTGLTVETSLHPFNSDHVPFIDKGVPAVLTIEGADNTNHTVHSAADTIDEHQLRLAPRHPADERRVRRGGDRPDAIDPPTQALTYRNANVEALPESIVTTNMRSNSVSAIAMSIGRAQRTNELGNGIAVADNDRETTGSKDLRARRIRIRCDLLGRDPERRRERRGGLLGPIELAGKDRADAGVSEHLHEHGRALLPLASTRHHYPMGLVRRAGSTRQSWLLL